MNTRRKVTQAFEAKSVSSRRREKFDAGELLMQVDNPGTPALSTFVRINGLRPSRGVECHYSMESVEWNEKTEMAKQAR